MRESSTLSPHDGGVLPAGVHDPAAPTPQAGWRPLPFVFLTSKNEASKVGVVYAVLE